MRLASPLLRRRELSCQLLQLAYSRHSCLMRRRCVLDSQPGEIGWPRRPLPTFRLYDLWRIGKASKFVLHRRAPIHFQHQYRPRTPFGPSAHSEASTISRGGSLYLSSGSSLHVIFSFRGPRISNASARRRITPIRCDARVAAASGSPATHVAHQIAHVMHATRSAEYRIVLTLICQRFVAPSPFDCKTSNLR